MNITNKINNKLFSGYLLTSEIRMHLNQSKIWHQISILPADDEKELLEVRHQGKDYIGRYLKESYTSLSDLKEVAAAIQQRLQDYCPNYHPLAGKVCIFSQVFVA